jgi:hypothetical protein
MSTAKTQSQKLRANGQKLRANGQKPPFSHTPATYPDDGVQSRSAAFPTLQVIGGRGNWDPYGRPQTTELQAVSGFPINQTFLAWMLLPPAPLPSDSASISHTR